MRPGAAALLALAAIMGILLVPVRRYRANLDRRQIARLVDRAEGSAAQHQRQSLALRAIDLTQGPLETNPADYKTLILRGAAEALAGRDETALATYHYALTINERPEIYAHIGVLQMERGDVDAAVTNLVKASTFNIAFASLVAPSTRRLIHEELNRRRGSQTR